MIVVAGSPHEPMTRAIAMDLERRGYIVYVTVSSADEEHIVQSENRVDIKPLWLDLTTVSFYPEALQYNIANQLK
jgi:hypothetical protein